jgi:Uma2 family endonuclease
MAVQEKQYSADDLWAMSHQEGDGKRLELVNGVIVEMSPTGDEHGLVTMEFGRLIANYVDSHDLGDVNAAETGYILSTDPAIVRAPDVSFISKERRTPITGGYYPIAPDLAVEVVSPSDSASDVQERVRNFRKAGTRLMWVAYPRLRTIVAHTTSGSRTLEADQVLDGGDVLPGFSVTVRDIFKKLRT